jgi:hypothetical protein
MMKDADFLWADATAQAVPAHVGMPFHECDVGKM